MESGFGLGSTSDSIDDKEEIKAKIKEFEEHIKIVRDEIKSIKEDETYQILQEIEI